MLIRYWKALGELWPQAIDLGTRDNFSLMKSVGVLTVHNIATTVFEAARAGGVRVTQGSIRTVLAPAAKALALYFWHNRTGEAGRVGTNNKAVRYLSDAIVGHVKPGTLAGSIL